MKCKKKALITGVNGQDGSLMAAKLLLEGFDVYGTYRVGSNQSLWRLQELGIAEKISLIDLEIGQYDKISQYVDGSEISHIFHFAGSSFTVSFDRNPIKHYHSNTSGVIDICEFARLNSPNSTIFVAGSSEIFGKKSDNAFYKASSKTRFAPYNFYGLSHISNIDICDFYRTNYNMLICNGIMFNHESEYRSEQFFSRKLSLGIARMLLDKNFTLNLGNIDVRKDMGCAKEFINSIFQTAIARLSGRLVIGTGTLISLNDVIFSGLKHVGFFPVTTYENGEITIRDDSSNRILVKSVKHLMRKSELDPWYADTSEMIHFFNRAPTTTLLDLISIMISKDYERMRGRIF